MGNDFSSFDVREKPMVTADSIGEIGPWEKGKTFSLANKISQMSKDSSTWSIENKISRDPPYPRDQVGVNETSAGRIAENSIRNAMYTWDATSRKHYGELF